MIRYVLFAILSFPIRSAFAQDTPGSDTLKTQVSEWDTLMAHPVIYGEGREVLSGTTHDLSLLDIRAYSLPAGRPFPQEDRPVSDQLLIVKEGSLTITINKMTKVLGPGGVGLFSAGEEPEIINRSNSPATCYIFRFRSRSPKDPQRAAQAGGPFLIDWQDIPMKRTDKGESRPIFSRPVAWLGKIDMHATTLNPGEVSHPQHTHRNEEIILLRSGHVQMHIANGYHKAAGGELVFLASGIPHALENKSSERCEYFALQWQP